MTVTRAPSCFSRFARRHWAIVASFSVASVAGLGCGSGAGSSDVPGSTTTGAGDSSSTSAAASSGATTSQSATVRSSADGGSMGSATAGVSSSSTASTSNVDTSGSTSTLSTSSSTASSVADSGPPPQDDGGVAIDSSLLAKCTGTSPIACHFGGPVGNYEVTVKLGGSSAAETSVMAEISRQMLGPVATAASETLTYNLMVNVRSPEGQPVADVGSKPSGLDLYFWGNGGKPALLSGIGYKAATPVVLYVATDSTGCDQTDTYYAGWAQWLPQYVDASISVANYGNSGVNTPGFLAGSAYFPAIKKIITPKDFLLIELGDNDKTDDPTSALTSMVTQTKAAGATPILMTPINRATFTGNTVNPYTTGNMPTVMKTLGQSQNVTVLDLTTRSTQWLQSLGPNGWHPYFAYDTSTGKYDSTHLNQTGANVIAGFVRDLVVEAKIPGLSDAIRCQTGAGCPAGGPPSAEMPPVP